MQNRIIKNKIVFLLIIIGLFGSIIFYPVKMESGRTCLFHKIIGGETVQMPDHISIMEQNHQILNRYLLPFGFIWWFSILLFAGSLYYLKNLTKRS